MYAAFGFPSLLSYVERFVLHACNEKRNSPCRTKHLQGHIVIADRQASLSVLSGSERSFRNVRSYCSGRS